LLVTAVISVFLVWLIPSVIQLWYVIGTLFIPPMLLPLLTAYFPQFQLKSRLTFQTMLLSFSIALSWFVWGQVNKMDGQVQYLFNLEPFFPGLLISVLIYLFGNFYRRWKRLRI